MIYNDIMFVDFETTGVNPNTCQPVQIAAVVIHGRDLNVIEGSEFQSLIRPEFDLEKCAALQLDPLTDGSIKVHGKTEEMLKTAPTPKVVWELFTQYVNTYNFKKTKWSAPILAGYNIIKYDATIMDRLCGVAPYKFGPTDDSGKCGLFNPRMTYDLLHDVFRWTHFNPEIQSISFDNIRKYTGMSTASAHDAMFDTKQGAFLLCKFLNLYKNMTPKIKIKDSCKGLV